MPSLIEQIKAATEDNMHTEAAMIGARAMNNKLGDAFLTILEEIDAIHELQGYIDRDYQKLRDALADQVNVYIKAMGLI